MLSSNLEIKLKAKEAGVKLWQIADRLGMNDGNFSRKLRHELPVSEKLKILTIIKQISKEGEKSCRA